MSSRRYHARMVLTPTGVVEDADLVLRGGRIEAVCPGRHPDAEDLGDVALVPGLINAHSHAFQRAIRGRTEYLRADRPTEDFWSWRDLMYRAALSLDAEAVEAVSAMAFLEMALSGITSVGEFHYLHHRRDGRAYAGPDLADRVICAARRVGLRIALLRVAYHRGGFDTPASPEQRRFVEPTVEVYLERATALRARWAHEPAVSVGLAPHSIRAVPRSWLEAIADHAAAEGLPLHIHACEQRAELVAARAEYGVEPIAALEAMGALGPRTALVHATHLEDDALGRVAARGCTVVACPTTERNLGDGFLPADALVAAGVPIALGSDSQAQIDLWAEARLVEYHERLRCERRNVLARHHPRWMGRAPGGRLETAALLWPMATAHGARALGLDGGALRPGAPADFVALDLADPCLAGLSPPNLEAQLVFSAVPRAVHAVYVSGEPVVSDGRHPAGEVIVARFREVMAGLG